MERPCPGFSICKHQDSHDTGLSHTHKHSKATLVQIDPLLKKSSRSPTKLYSTLDFDGEKTPSRQSNGELGDHSTSEKSCSSILKPGQGQSFPFTGPQSRSCLESSHDMSPNRTITDHSLGGGETRMVLTRAIGLCSSLDPTHMCRGTNAHRK